METKKGKKKWGKWVLLAFVLYCVIGGAMEAFSGSVSSEEDGIKVLEEIFPPEDGYEIYADGITWVRYEDEFDEPEVGGFCEAYEGKGNKVDTYSYTVELNGSSTFTTCAVSEKGKVIGAGPLVSESEPDTLFRLK